MEKHPIAQASHPVKPLRAVYLSARDGRAPTGGGAVYGAAVGRVLSAARPGWSLVDARPENGTPGPWHHRLRQVTALAGALTGGPPATTRFSLTRDLRAATQRVAAEAPADLLVLDGIDVAPFAPAFGPSVPRLLVGHNIEYQLFADRLAALPAPARAAFRHLLGEPARYERYERAIWASVRGVVHISETEAAAFPPNLPSTVLPPVFAGTPPSVASGPDHPAGTAASPRPPGPWPRIGLVAKLTWWPNRQALDWVLRAVWPQVPAPAELHLFGMGSERLSAPEARIFGHGFVPDADELWSRIDLAIVPVLSGGGVNVKLCEALWRGLPCLATPVALRGLPTINDPAVAVHSEAADWVRVLSDTGPEALVRQRPDPRISRLFDEAAAVERMAGWLDSIGFGNDRITPNA